ncbi:MAG: hypothetical protein MUF81_00815 [Verrucomicrobia bacterium]|nr:hypothetical protein [Verrucomicrobiota bacterium]
MGRILMYSVPVWVGALVVVLVYKDPAQLFKWPARQFWRLRRWFFSWRILKRLLFALAALLVLVGFFYAEENWRGKRAWENYRRDWEAKGEHFDFAYFIPPPVTDDQNFALTPIVASCYRRVMDGNGQLIKPENTNVVNRLEMSIYRQRLSTGTNLVLGNWQKSQLTNLKAWQDYYRTGFLTNEIPDGITDGQLVTRTKIEPLAADEFPTAPQPQTPAADVLLALSNYDAAIEELRQASRLPYSRFPLNYTIGNPAEMMVPHYQPLKSAAGALRLRAVAELNDGRSANALADVRLIFYLADSIRNEPITLSLRMRMALVDNAVQPIWEGLAQRRWSDEQLAVLERELAGFDAVSDYDRTLRSDLAWQLKLIDYLLAGRMTNSVTCMCDKPMFWPTLEYRLTPSGWFQLNKVALARCYQAAFPTPTELSQRILSPDIARRFEKTMGPVRSRHLKPGNWLVNFLLRPLEREANLCARTQASVDLARVACALQRFRQANGAFPEALDALAPKFIQKIPHDVVNGQPLHYRRMEDGNFLLYSVGWNEKDDGGEPKPVRMPHLSEPAGDWVWRYPAN